MYMFMTTNTMITLSTVLNYYISCLGLRELLYLTYLEKEVWKLVHVHYNFIIRFARLLLTESE